MEEASMTLVDTSSWVEALRSDGSSDVRQRVRQLLIEGQAAWCDLVSLELWNGARGEYEKKKLSELEKEITCLSTTDGVWRLARELARKSRDAGKTTPAADLVISACAFFHKVEIDHCDQHFDIILQLHKSAS
ncbi:MAG: PIN domain-containing protein [Thermodesulfobacteriota bacterium]